MAEAYLVAAARTAGGRKGGRLAGWHPADLAAQVLDAVVARSGIDPARVDDVIMGCVGQAGEQSANIGRNAVLASGLPESVPATSIDRQCGSSQQAVQFAAQAVMSGTMDIVIAAGVESMTRVPMGTPSSLPFKNGMGHYMSPNIRSRYPGPDFSQFMGAEMMAKKYNLTREQLDAYALSSHQRAIAATQAGAFKDEIIPVHIKTADGVLTDDQHLSDEGIRYDATLESIAGVKLIQEGGMLTAATASQICDGAAAVMVVSEKVLKEFNLTPMARVHHMTLIGHDPVIMLEAPLPATERALKKCGMKIDDIDLFEVNEAFASVPVAWLQYTGA
ncbi:MAG: acetyl-CoA C-acetyltransferase, partial [Burkholderiales bacterium]